MSINRERLAGLVAVLALLAPVVLPGSAAAAPPVAQAPGRPVARAPGSQAALVAAPPAALAAGSQTVAAPVPVGSWLGAAPGALGATTVGTGVVGAGTAGTADGNAGTGSAGDSVAPPRVKASSMVLADEETGQVLFERAERQPRAMASTTKVMTGLLALEQLDERRTVVIGREPTAVGEESLELHEGERLTVHQLLLGLLVKSANDAAVALADAVDGSAAAFVRRMNARAAELGLRDTHYVTPYGLDRPGHHTSARDLARLWAVGGKTGFTNDAKRCLVASASRGGRRLVAVVLGSPDASADVRALFEYGFTAFDWVRLARRGQAVTLAGTGQTAVYQVTADVDALVRQDLLGELALAPPTRILGAPSAPAATAGGTASTTGGAASSTASTAAGGTPSAVPGSGGTLTVWIQAGGQRLAPLRLGPPGSAPATIDPFLRRASP